MFEAEGKVALVTGALGGIGRCYVKALLKNGLKGVALVDIDDADSEDFQKELEEEFGERKSIFIKIDVADSAQIKEAFEQTVKHFHQLDIVVNNVGIFDEVNIERSISVNLVSTAVSTNLAIKSYLPKYRVGEEGVVVNTASVAGLEVYQGFPTYCLAKHAIVTLGRCLGTPEHYALSKVKVLTICPGMTQTNLINHMENIPAFLLEISKKKVDEDRKKCQGPEPVGEGLIKVMKEGANGSVWLIQNSRQAQEIDFSEMDRIMMQKLQ